MAIFWVLKLPGNLIKQKITQIQLRQPLLQWLEKSRQKSRINRLESRLTHFDQCRLIRPVLIKFRSWSKWRAHLHQLINRANQFDALAIKYRTLKRLRIVTQRSREERLNTDKALTHLYQV